MKYIKAFEKNLLASYYKNEQDANKLKAILSLINKYIELNGYKYENYLNGRNFEIDIYNNSYNNSNIKGKITLTIWNNKINIIINTPNFKYNLIKYNNIFDFFIIFLKNIDGLKYDKNINLMGGIDNEFKVTNYQKVIDNLSKEIKMIQTSKKYNIL
jgi:hypothetical protein